MHPNSLFTIWGERMLFPFTFYKREVRILLDGLTELIGMDFYAVSSGPCHNGYFRPESVMFAQLVVLEL